MCRSCAHRQLEDNQLIGSLRFNGCPACMLVEGATNQRVFREYVRQVLVPTLKPGDWVIADNLSVHKDLQARQYIESAGARLVFLPAYSPDLNPIEKMGSKVKQFLRAAKARSQEALEQGVAQALQTITADDAKDWFQNCGYALSQ